MEPAGPERPPPTTDDGEASAVWVDGSSGLSYVVKVFIDLLWSVLGA